MECVVDEETLEHMIRLAKKGWAVRVWKPGDPDCWVALNPNDHN